MNKKRIFAGLAVVCAMAMGISACGQKDDKDKSKVGFNTGKDITVVSRDSASGTRTAFHELMKITVKEGDKEVDKLVTGSLEFDSTDKVITAVEGDEYGIGYVSMGSISSRIGTFKVDGVEATQENVKNGTYKVSRPFLIVNGKTPSPVAQDFLDYALSGEGQKIVSDKGYIKANDASKAYSASGKTGTVKITGSTSVEPIMQKLIEGYKGLNPGVSFEMQCQGSSQGIKSAIDGSSDLGLSSRELKEDEKAKLKSNTLALDGIAVIKNNKNTILNISSQTLTDIYTGKISKWSDVK